MYSLEIEADLQYPQSESSYFSYVEDKLSRQSTFRAVLLGTDSSEPMIVEYLDCDAPEAQIKTQAFDGVELKVD